MLLNLLCALLWDRTATVEGGVGSFPRACVCVQKHNSGGKTCKTFTCHDFSYIIIYKNTVMK